MVLSIYIALVHSFYAYEIPRPTFSLLHCDQRACHAHWWGQIPQEPLELFEKEVHGVQGLYLMASLWPISKTSAGFEAGSGNIDGCSTDALTTVPSIAST
jgi:hypothetical protein